MPKLAARCVVALCPCLLLAQTAVPKWSVYKIHLTAAGTSSNWYTDPAGAVTATFSGPGGAAKRVNGFWDGGNRFEVRFTPTAGGTWTYQTSSPNAGLNGKSGTFTCTAPKPGSHGFLRIDARSPYTFVWDDGTRFFMWGQSYYDILQPAMVNDHWKTSVDKSLGYGMNKLRMHVYAQNYYKPDVEFTKYPDAQPYPGPSTSPDRDGLNILYWHKLDEMVRYMEDRGMVADLIVTNPYWDNREFGTAAQNDRLIRYVLARYAASANVIWCLANEWDLSSTGKQYKGTYRQKKPDFDRMGVLMRQGDPWIAEGPYLRPLSIHNTTIGFEFFDSSWPTYAIIQYGGWNPDFDNGDQWGNAGIIHNRGHKMPVVNDEYGYIGQVSPKPSVRVNMTRARLRGAAWGIAIAGGYGSIGDFRVTPDGMGNVEITGDWLDAPEEYGDLHRMIEFFSRTGLEYWKMSAQNDLLTAGTRAYLLAETGRRYIIYAAAGGDFSLNLVAGKYEVRRFDPVDGTEIGIGAATGGGVRAFSTPGDHDYVVSLTRVR